MSNITNSTSSSDGADSVVASIAGIFVFLGALFFCFYFIPKWCYKKARQRFDTSKKAPVVPAYPVYEPVQAYPVQIPEATSVSIVDSDENRKIFFKNNNINLPCSKKDLDLLEKLMEARKYRYIEVFYRNIRGISRGMYIIVQGAVYLLKYQFDENGELKQELENPDYITVPTIPKDPRKIYLGRKIYDTYKNWKKQRTTLKF